jgi:signal transduction histidine kinase
MKLISIIMLCLLQTGIFAQKTGQAKIDSILQTLPSAKEDSFKVKALNQICEIYLTSNPARSIGYADQALAIAKKIDWKKGIARVLNLKGLVVGDTGNNNQARVYFQMSYDIQKQIENKSGMITSLNNIGRNYQRESNFSSALDYYFKALSIAEEIKSDEQIALVGTNLTASYLTQGNYTKGMEYGEMTLKHAETAHSLTNIGKALQLMGNARMHQKDTAAAKDYLARALKVYQEMDNPSAIAHVLSDMAELDYPNYTKELELMLQAQKILDEVSPTGYASIGNLGNLGVTYSDLGANSGPAERKAAFDKAEYYLNRAVRVCKENGNTEYLATLYGNISSLEEQRGHYKSALENLKSNFFINDSLFSQDKKNELASMENKHNIDLKNKEIEVSQLELVSQRKTKIGLISGLALLAIIGGLLLWQNQMRKKSNTTLMVLNNQLDEANKVKAKFFGILSHDLRSPTSSLINFLHLLKNEPELLSAGERSSYQQQIAESTQELLQTMETMLIWSKEQMDNFKPQIRIVQVSDLFEYLQKFFAHTTQINIVFNNPEWLEVSSDENYLKVIMQNLTSNAIKALKNNPDGTIVWKARKEGMKTVLSITDNGPGIHADQIKALFNQEMAVNAKTGFGFHMIRDLAKAIQYHISIESKLGIGTTFVLSA